MCTLYRSSLKAMLIMPKVRIPFDNLEELVESGIKLGIPKSSPLNTPLKVHGGDGRVGGEGGVSREEE